MAGPAADADAGDQGQDDVLGADARLEPAGDLDFEGLGLALEQRLRGQDHLDLARPDAERQRPEGAVRGGVGVAADDGHARLRQPELRPDDVDDAARGAALAVERDPELAAVLLDLGQLLAGQLVDDRDRRIGRGDRMVGRRDGLARLANLQSALAQAGERLRARDLVDEV